MVSVDECGYSKQTGWGAASIFPVNFARCISLDAGAERRSVHGRVAREVEGDVGKGLTTNLDGRDAPADVARVP
jgi:hypothetical protein